LIRCADSVAEAAESLAGKAPQPPFHGILYNEDDSNRFVLDPPGAMKPERLDQVVDELADSQVAVMLICCCAKKVNYPSKVWDLHCEGFDPNQDNNQPYFGDTPQASRPVFRQWAQNLQLMLNSGVDPMQRMIDRCRKRRISPWVTIRMNDVHEADLMKSCLHSRFWTEHHDYWRYSDRYTGWNDRAFNYALKPVRDYFMALIEEVCNRFDVDGLELDWNRWPLQFREGEEGKQADMLTAWLADVRQTVRKAEKKWGHPICLAARVPARPEVAKGVGLDAVAWARHNLIDHLIVSPFFSTTDFDIPVDRWNELLQGTGVGVTAGLERQVQAYPGGPLLTNTPELRRGAAMAALARGSQGTYVFNYFDVGSKMPYLLKEMGSVDTLADKDRTYAVTYVDITMPGKLIPPALPKTVAVGMATEFMAFIGPKPLPTARGEVQVALAADKPGEKCTAKVFLNGHPSAAGPGFTFASDVFCSGYNTICVVNTGATPMSIQSVTLSLRFPSGKK
jgi:hypothetical protein